MKTLYAIKDDSANQVVSLYFVAQSEIEAIRQFKGFVQSGKYPAFPKELGLYEIAMVEDDGSLCQMNNFVKHFSTNESSYTLFDSILLCRGDGIENAYIEYSRLNQEDFDKLKIEKNVTEAEFDEEIKNGDFGR